MRVHGLPRSGALRTPLLLAALALAVCGAAWAQGADAPGSWTKDTSPVSFEWYDNTATITHAFDPATSLVDGIIAKKTGVSINFSSPPEESYEKLNAMISSNSLPDIVTLSYDPTVVTWGEMQQSGQLWPVLELMDKYAPEMRKALPTSMVDWYKHADGKLYGVTSYFFAPERMPKDFPLYTSAGMVARKDIMDALGIKAKDFSTKAGFMAALKKVKASGLKGDNGKPVTPIYLSTEVTDVLAWVLASMFGAYEEDADGAWVDKITTPKYLEALQFANLLYREGLIDIGNFTSSMSQVKEMALSGGLFAYLGHMGDFRGTAQMLFSKMPQRKYVPVECVRADDGAPPLFSSQNTNGWTMTCISRSCKKPDRAIRLLSYLYSKEGQMTTLFGQEGRTYTLVNGKAQFTPALVEARKTNAAKAIKDYTVGYYFMMKDPVFERVMTAPAVDDYTRVWDDIRLFFSRYVYSDRVFDVSPAAGSDEEAIMAQIQTYEEQFLPKVVMAGSEAEVQALYKQMLQHEDELGRQALLKLEKAKFQENKKRLGVKYGLPIYTK
jgi:putative aldouronate transport system substrate-binding protein